MSKGPRRDNREASWFLRACRRLCDQTAVTGFTSMVEAAIPEQPSEVGHLFFDPNLPLPGRRVNDGVRIVFR